ncbi:HAMP domain-containing histidine kinase [Bombilactobacillus folatiphilus]|uniref:histidine kinase n=1 Tax=Bombilactobacillus folatiphilus TaxID=2923362 RepID=A0ABY4PA73_9LACO|nr:HAMP domain-containing sensor histidine kinase [Bombilactobacillus folatiphilus]UQS82507.1 HAMP domain-containing histidine kinase [Bombilactobacillus folatiphilus]
MKLIYQYMLGFLVVVGTCLGVISIAIYSYSESMAYRQTWMQLEGYSDNLQKMALRVDPRTGTIDNITTETLDDMQDILADQKVNFVLFDKIGRELYPNRTSQPLIDAKTLALLRKGNTIRERNSTERSRPRVYHKRPMTYIMKPWFDQDNKMVAILLAGSEVSAVETNINTIKRNLLVALLVSVFIALVLSWFLANWQVKRIDKLRQATKQVAGGDFDVKIATDGQDELDDLAHDFNAMTISLQDYDQEIKRQEQRRKDFMADASHEMRTPLTTINGLLEGLAYDAIPAENRGQSIQLMRNETKRLIRLVNENLDYEKIRTNQIPLHQRSFDVQDCLQNIVSQLQEKATTSQDQLVLQAPDDLQIYADYDRFIQIVFNITQNAIQFTNQGLITIKAWHDDQQHAVLITISDNGIGMSSDQVKNIWERYYKADPSRKNTKYGESGLGLAIVHQLMQQHHGKIQVRSHLEQGTTFTLTFYDQEVIRANDTDQN